MACGVFLIAGCDRVPESDPVDVVDFCLVEEERRFSQVELDWRAEFAPWNLRRDFKTNTTFERECMEGE